MPPNSSPRLYITFHEKAGVTRGAIIPFRPTHQHALSDALKTFGLSEDYDGRCGFKYGRRLGEAIVWMELLPESWGLLEDGDDLLLYFHRELESQTAAMESSATLVPAIDATHGVVENSQETKLCKQPERPIVRYRYANVIKGLEHGVAYATSFLPDTYKEAVDTAVSALNQNTLTAGDLKIERVVLWARILDEKGNRVGAGVPQEQLIEFMRETLKKDPNCSIAVMPLPKV